MNYIVIFILFGIYFQAHGSPCSKSDPNAEECVYQKLWDLYSLDPLLVAKVNIDQKLSDTIYMKANISNGAMIGFKNSVRDYYSIDLDTFAFDMSFTLPEVALELDYSVIGKLLVIPLNSEGHMKGSFTDVKMRLTGSYDRIKIGDTEYFKVTQGMQFISTIGNGSLKLKAFNPLLQISADLIANFFNANVRLVLDAVNPIYQVAGEQFFQTYLDEKLRQMPVNEIIVD